MTPSIHNKLSLRRSYWRKNNLSINPSNEPSRVTPSPSPDDNEQEDITTNPTFVDSIAAATTTTTIIPEAVKSTRSPYWSLKETVIQTREGRRHPPNKKPITTNRKSKAAVSYKRITIRKASINKHTIRSQQKSIMKADGLTTSRIMLMICLLMLSFRQYRAAEEVTLEPTTIKFENNTKELPSEFVSPSPSIETKTPIRDAFRVTSSRRAISTSFEGNNKSFGNMFNIRALKSLTIESFEIHAGGVSTTENNMINVEIWTRNGTFHDHHLSSDGWIMLAKSSVQNMGFGNSTPIPDNEFVPVFMEENHTQAFFITLTTPDLWYTDDTNSSIKTDDLYCSNSDIEIFAGAGIGQHSFGNSYFGSRLWNGIVNYLIHTPSQVQLPDPEQRKPEPPFLSYHSPHGTTVLFTFYIEYEKSVEIVDELLSVQDSVMSYIQSAFQDKTMPFKKMVDRDGLKLISTTASAHNEFNDETCQVASSANLCSYINVAAMTIHDDTLSSQIVRHGLLQLGDYLASVLKFPMKKYVGHRAPTMKMVFHFSASNFKMTASEVSDFGNEIKIFLEGVHTVDKPPVNITSVLVRHQEPFYLLKSNVYASNRASMSNKTHYAIDTSSETNSISTDVFITISGEYLPYPIIDFSTYVLDIMNSDGSSLFQKVMALQGFENVEGITVRPGSYIPTRQDDTFSGLLDEELEPTTSNEIQEEKKVVGGWTYWASMLTIFGVAFAFYMITKRIKVSNNTTRKNATEVDAIMNGAGTWDTHQRI